MAATDITFINAALTRTGSERINSLDDDNARARVANANYEVIVLAELGAHRWNWAAKFAALNQLEDSAPEPWTYAYQLPVELRQLRTLRQNGLVIDYALMGRMVMTTVDNTDADVVAHYDWRPPEESWPPWWSEPLIKRLEAVFLRSIGERHGEAAERDKEAKAGFVTARRLDSQSQSPRDPFEYPILAARRG